ncbi:MAG: hypothetical protein O7C59_00270 [Rickettsia endosymbiont of Ixodes persulcatus]|nr:hypothetical protein [Rickettsia endosymbiont of Ixodes persulcatus]
MRRLSVFYVIPAEALLRGLKNAFAVMPWLDHGIQLKIVIL